jgi:hypothetical protein
MATPLRVLDAPDLLKLLMSTTGDDVPDNPAEQLSDFVPSPATGSDDVVITDSVTVTARATPPNYLYNAADAIWGLAQYG